MTLLTTRTSVIEILGDEIDVTQGAVTLDETTTYAVAELTIPLLRVSDVDAIDPKTGMRATITHAIDDGTPRTFDLGIRSRRVVHETREVELRLASDEELADDYTILEEDSSALDHQDSLRAIVSGAITAVVPGAVLAAGDDSPFPVSWDSTNLILNPGAEAGTAGISVNAVSVTDSTLWAESGARSFHLYGPSSVDSYAYFNLFTLGASKGRTYTASGTVFINSPLGGSSGTLRRSIAVIITTSTGPVVFQSDIAPNVTGTTRLAVKFTIPPNALQAALFYCHGHSAGDIWWDNLRLSEGDGIKHRDIGRLDGNMATTDLYSYEWDDTTNNSVARRTALEPVPPETLVWPAGVSAWKFLLPITSRAGVRLFCDESRVWHLVGADYSVEGVVVVSQDFSSRGEDEITRDGDTWADGVIARYRWDDDFGARQERLDTAGEPGKVRVVDFDRPYPGPGAAAAILSRMAGQGRTQNAEIKTVITATPGQEASFTLPGTEPQSGRVTRVRFGLSEAFSEIGTRGLTGAGPDTYLGWSYDSYADTDPALEWEDA